MPSLFNRWSDLARCGSLQAGASPDPELWSARRGERSAELLTHPHVESIQKAESNAQDAGGPTSTQSQTAV